MYLHACTYVYKKRRKGTIIFLHMKIFCKKSEKYLHNSKKSSTFAPDFERITPFWGPRCKPARRLQRGKRSTERRRHRATRSRITRSSDASAYGGLSSVGRASDCGSECRGELKTKTLIRCN
jgi:hypothetical protein